MKTKDLRQKNKEELLILLKERRDKLNELKFMLHQKKIKNVKEIASVRKDIAKVLTIIKES